MKSTPELSWVENVRWREFDSAATASLQVAASEQHNRERARTLCSLARVSARAAGDVELEQQAVAGLQLIELGDLLLSGEEDDDEESASEEINPLDDDEEDVIGKFRFISFHFFVSFLFCFIFVLF